MLLDTITGEIVHPDEIGELPTPDDETPDLIIPEAQATKGQEPLPKDYQVDTDKVFEKMKSASEKPQLKSTGKEKPKTAYPEDWKPANIGEMVKWAWEVKAISRDMLMETLGIRDTIQISDLDKAFQKMKEIK